MSPTRRLIVIAVAWAVPIAWVLSALLAGPSDGTTLSRATSDGDDWAAEARIARAYGRTPLRAGDAVLTVDGRSIGEWLATSPAPTRQIGDVVTYEVRRPAPELDRILELDVTLDRYPLAAAAADNLPAVSSCLLLLLAGSGVFWKRPDATASQAFLAATSLVPAAMTSSPWGIGAIDLAGSRGSWPMTGGEAVASVGIGAALLAAATLAPPAGWLRHRWTLAVAFLVPLTGYGVWLAVALGGTRSEGARLQVIGTIAAPALLATVPAILVVAAIGHRRAVERVDVVATRLLVLGVGAGVAAWLLLDTVPRWLSSDPLVPRRLLLLLVLTGVLGCAGAAIAHYRLGEIEPRVRRGLVQLVVLSLVAGAFVGIVRAADVAIDISVGSMLAGGLAALLLLPVAVAVQRAVRRVVYGDRESPHRVVSDLRRLDPTTAPEDALGEMLELLARRLHLSYAAVDVFATATSKQITAAIGTSYGAPATVDLAVGGARLGRLSIEVDTAHDPFGPGDRRLLEDVGSQVGALVQAVTVNRELQRSRQRLVAAREEERRRIRRDLHDGLGPSLATLAMRLEAAQDLIAQDPGAAAELVGRLSDQAREEIAEVRRLVDGLRPPALDQLGLVSALRQRAAEHSSGRTPTRMPWSVEAADGVDPLPAAVEVAAYRIAVEAVNNAQRHSGADACVVTIARAADALLLTIRDTGSGLAPGHPVGVGLSSMRERAEELGGSFAVVADEGSGTVVRVRLPLVDGVAAARSGEE